MIAQVKSSKEPWATWAKVKFDIQIVAIAKAEAASVIYADDKDIENYAKRLKIPVVRICDLPLPPPPEPEITLEVGAVGAGEQPPLPGMGLIDERPQVVTEAKQTEQSPTLRPCECGCGEFPKDPTSRFLLGHDLRKAYKDSQGLNKPK